MKRTLDYKCPLDVGTMSEANGHLFCNQCQKKVHNFNDKSDFEVLYKLNGLKGEKCVSIQTGRLPLVTNKISKWKLFLLIVINLKTFFFQKLYAQIPKQDTASSPTAEPILRTLKGNVLDKRTGKAVKFPVVEMYKSNILIETINGDRNGNFILRVRGPAGYADTITLRIYSDSYSGSIIEQIKLSKLNTKLVAKIPKKGVRPIVPDNQEKIEIIWTGRLLE